MKLSMTLRYIMERDSFEIESEFKPDKNIEIVEDCIRRLSCQQAQMGAGSDTRDPAKKDVYTVKISRDDDDKIQVESDTGNDTLTCGLMTYYLERQ